MGESNNFFSIFLGKVGSIPGVQVNRENYLRSVFRKEYKGKMEQILLEGPINAGVPMNVINKYADKSIKNEALLTTGASFLSGLPGGIAMGISIPGDILNYYARIFIIVQKLMYLYGWEDDIFDSNGEIDDTTMNALIIYIGFMMGVKPASTLLAHFAAKNVTKMASGVIAKSIIKNGASRRIIIKIVQMIGVKSSVKGAFTVGTKAVPVISGFVSGGITAATFIPSTKKLQNFFKGEGISASELE